MDYGPGSKAIENSLSRDVNGSASSNIDSTAELIRHHPVLQALIKLEVSNSLLRLQLGDDATECLQERLDTVLSDNTCLVQRMAEIERQNHASRSRRDTADSIGDKDGRDSLDGKAGDSVVSQLSAMIKRSSFTSKSRSASEDGGAKGSANNVAPSAVAQSPAPRSTVNHQSGVGSRIVAIGNSSGEQSAAEITATYVTPPRRLLSGASGPLGGVGVAEITRPSESSATSSSHGDRAVKSVEISPEANDHLNFVEVCEIGMDRKILTGAVAATTSLQNAQVVNVFPPRANTNSDGHFDTIIPNITDFCFPNGVPVDIVSASAAEYITGPPYDSYHVIQFVDPNVGVIYGCCIIISEMVKPMNKTVEDNLVDLKRRKRAADIICCRLKHYIRYREHLRWTKPSIVLVGNYHNNGGIAHRSVPGRRVSDSNIDCKQDGSFSSPNANIGGNVPDTQERKTMLSRLTKWGRKDTPSSSAKGRPADPATPSGFTDINGGAPLTTGTNVFTISEHESASTSPNATHQDRLAADSSSPAVEASNATKTPGTVKKRFSWFSSNTAALASTSTKPENVKSSKDYMAGTESPPPYGANLSTPDISTRSPSESIGTADGDDQDDGFVAEGGTPLANHDEFSDSEHGETQLSSSRAALQSMYNLDVYKSGKSKRSNDNSLDAGSDHSHNDEVRPVVYKRKKKGGGAGKMIVTKKAFCVLSHTPCHAFMFKVLQKIIDTESLAHDASKHNSKLVRTMSPYGDVLSGAGEGTVSEAIDRAGILRGRCQSAGAADDITGVLNDILSDVKVYDVSNSKDGHASSPLTVDSHHANVANNHANPESSVITEAIMRMQLKNRNDFLSVAQKYDLSVIGQHVDKGRLTAASPNVGQTSSGTAANEEQYPPYCTLDCRNYFLEPLKIYKTQSTFRVSIVSKQNHIFSFDAFQCICIGMGMRYSLCND